MILLVHLPFCTPVTPSYSVTALHGYLLSHGVEANVLDLNLKFHERVFPGYKEYYQAGAWEDYDTKTKEYLSLTGRVYSLNNKSVVEGKDPELFDELLGEILSRKPGVVAFSIVYSSQVFYALRMLKALKKEGITTVVGGPAVNDRLLEVADQSFSDGKGFLEFINGGHIDESELKPLDFTIWDSYFTPSMVIPLKTTSTCFYQKCTFCSHHANVPYEEYDLDWLRETIRLSGKKFFFLIDDMIPKKRLLDFAKMIKPFGVHWACQLRPTHDLDQETLKTLSESGLDMVMWGVESGSERVLSLIGKGTNPKDISTVLRDARTAGIANIVYVIFGFPTETKEEFLETISFLEQHSDAIDLVSGTVFGLQKGTEIYRHPERFGITRIFEEKRTVLDPKIGYEVSSGLTQEEAMRLKSNHRKMLQKIGGFPKSMNFFREHMLWEINKRTS